MDFIVAPGLCAEVTFEEIPVEKIIGIDFVLPSKEERLICCFPVPVAIDCGGMFELVPDNQYWFPDLNGVHCSHIHCMVLESDIGEETKQQVRVVLETIHANRTLKKRRDICRLIKEVLFRREILENVYGLDPIMNLSELLIGNGYSERHQLRLAGKGKGQSLHSKDDKMVDVNSIDSSPSDDMVLKELWNAFAKEHPDVWTFDRIVDAFPAKQQIAAKAGLETRIEESGNDLMNTWLAVRDGLKKEGYLDE